MDEPFKADNYRINFDVIGPVHTVDHAKHKKLLSDFFCVAQLVPGEPVAFDDLAL
jgi:hypothetical protein